MEQQPLLQHQLTGELVPFGADVYRDFLDGLALDHRHHRHRHESDLRRPRSQHVHLQRQPRRHGHGRCLSGAGEPSVETELANRLYRAGRHRLHEAGLLDLCRTGHAHFAASDQRIRRHRHFRGFTDHAAHGKRCGSNLLQQQQ